MIDINVIQDLKINNGIIDEKYIFDKLKSKNNWIVQMMLVKNAVKPYIKIIDSNNPNLAADGLNTNIIGKLKVLYTKYNSSLHVIFSWAKWNRRLGVPRFGNKRYI